MITAKEIKAKVIPRFLDQIENLNKRRTMLVQIEVQIQIDMNRIAKEIVGIQSTIKHLETWSDDAEEPRV